MSSKKFIKNLVSNKIYKRGIDYYQQGLVLQYRIKKIEANLYQISAQVSGDKKYNVMAKVSLSETEVEFDSHCDCPYDWESYCKHEIAVLYKFMQEDFNSTKVNYEAELTQEIAEFKAEQKDFQSNLVEQKIADRSFKNLLEFSKNYDENEIPKLDYQVKGLLDQSLKNFKLILKSDYLSKQELEQLIDSLNESNSYHYYQASLVQKHFYGNELEIIEKLASLNKSKGRGSSLLLNKNEENLNFLLDLSQKFELKLAENEEVIKKGKN